MDFCCLNFSSILKYRCIFLCQCTNFYCLYLFRARFSKCGSQNKNTTREERIAWKRNVPEYYDAIKIIYFVNDYEKKRKKRKTHMHMCVEHWSFHTCSIRYHMDLVQTDFCEMKLLRFRLLFFSILVVHLSFIRKCLHHIFLWRRNYMSLEPV